MISELKKKKRSRSDGTDAQTNEKAAEVDEVERKRAKAREVEKKAEKKDFLHLRSIITAIFPSHLASLDS